MLAIQLSSYYYVLASKNYGKRFFRCLSKYHDTAPTLALIANDGQAIILGFISCLVDPFSLLR